jgi:adenosylcobinamide-GDP ribazoletransferase
MSWLRAPAAAFGFLTRLPAPRGALDAPTLGRALAFFPLVGSALGAVQALAGHVLVSLLGASLAAVLLVVLAAVLTAGLHLDGLCDVCDGLGGSRGEPARALAIMRDSRIGSFGALALVLVVLTKVAALEALLAQGAWRPIALAPVAARAAAVGLIVLFPYARAEGLGRSFHDHGGARELAIALITAALVTALLDVALLGVALGALGIAALLGAWLRRRLGGLTGDAYGAAIELTEAACLVLALAIR